MTTPTASLRGSSTTSRAIAVTTHGRYLVAPPAMADAASLPALPPALLIVGFHGYMENAEAQLDRLRSIPGTDRSVLVSIQGLHRFYRGRTQEIAASWMTRQDRELAIADNANFVAAVVDEVAREWPTASALVFAGFSQGASMAVRSACWSPRPVSGVITLGGDVPPEIEPSLLARLPATLVGRGARDEWYSQEKFERDVTRLREAGVDVRPFSFDAGHEWTPAFSAEAGEFLLAHAN